MDLFQGNIHNYGQHEYKFTGEGKKESGKSWTVTDKLLTAEQYKAHLNGEIGLGVIPLTTEGECRFGVIDIDVYDADLNTYIEAIERNNFPLVPFRSKSGGLHIYAFFKQAVNAKPVIDMMQNMIILLGLDLYIKQKLNKIIEVFPKQSRAGDGKIGNWINLPYYDFEKSRQRAIKGGKELDLSDALTLCKERRRTMTDFRNFVSELGGKDGPPCLQTIQILNAVDKGGRNHFMFSLGVYLKKKDPDFWEQKLFEANATLRSPLPKAELESTVIASLRKKEYSYKCTDVPCVDFCRKQICKTREFGIGKEGGYFSELEFGKLMQYKLSTPYYEWEVKLQGAEAFVTLRFKSEDEIIQQDAFLRLCVRELHVLPVKMKQAEWFKIINQALTEVEVKTVELEDDTSPITLFKQLFIEFLTERASAQTKDQILTGRVYFDATTSRYLFRTQDLADWVFNKKMFRYLSPGELHAVLRDFKAQTGRIKTESGRGVRVYEMTTKDLNALGQVRNESFKAEFTANKEEF
jgi:hypothetical protein